jgi:serine/threonine kinase 38
VLIKAKNPWVVELKYSF